MEDLSKKTIAKKYKFVTPDDVKRFTWETSRFKGRVDCFELYRTVSGKSVLGMFSLDLSQPVIVKFYDVYGNEPMFNELKEWEVE